jgi:hypothetical protein
MNEEELAALGVALELLAPPAADEPSKPVPSRWKLAARMPDLEMEELRALH